MKNGALDVKQRFDSDQSWEQTSQINAIESDYRDTGKKLSLKYKPWLKENPILDSMELPKIENDPILKPPKLPSIPPPRSTFRVEQKWEGWVTEATEHSFKSIVRDLDNDKAPREEVEFDYDEVSPSDRPLIKKGAIFYWHIGKEMQLNGEIRGLSLITFRRLPIWREKDLEYAKLEGGRLFERFISKQNPHAKAE